MDARSRFSELIERAERGEETIVTKRGRPVARIVPAKPRLIKSPEERQKIIEQARRLRESIAAYGGTFTQAEIREMINEGRH